jgi:ribulose bisphosphate carboxylase small subunit
MIFWLLPSAFQVKFENELDMLRICSQSNRAFLRFDIENTQVAAWCSNNKKSNWEEIFRCWISDATKFKQTNLVKVCGDIGESDWECQVPLITPKDAATLVQMPNQLNLENQVNDLNFIKCVVDKYTRKQIEDKIFNSSLIPSSGGIGEVKNKLVQCNNALILKCKMFVMIDSDCKNIDSPQQDAIDVKELCQAKGVSHHVLSRRMIENYYPLELLYDDIPLSSRENTPMYKKVKAFCSLNDEQRFCFHLKKGLKDVNAHSRIYDDIEESVSSLLNDGFSRIAVNYADESKQEQIHYAMLNEFESDEVKILAQNIKNHLRTPV